VKDVRVPSEGNYKTVQITENIPLLANRSKDNALLDNITMCDRVVGNAERMFCLFLKKNTEEDRRSPDSPDR
jgi:hypothetical protein